MGERDLPNESRSSSLSEIDARMEDEQAQSGTIATGSLASEHDSEAETERLERSPEKPRKHADAGLSLDSDQVDPENRREALVKSTRLDGRTDDRTSPMEWERNGTTESDFGIDKVLATSRSDAVMSPGEATLSGAYKVPTPPEVAGQKRKRPDGENGNGDASSDDAEADEPLKKRTGSVRGEAIPENLKVEENGTAESPNIPAAPEYAEEHLENGSDVEPLMVAKRETTKAGKVTRKGRRKGLKHATKRHNTAEVAELAENEEREKEPANEDAGIPPGDAEDLVEPGEEDEDVDVAVRNEEGSKSSSRGCGFLVT